MNEIVKFEWKNTFKIDNYISWNKDIVIYDIPDWIPLSMFNNLVEYILEWKDIPKFDENRNIINGIYSDYILVEYNDKNIRNIDIENNKKINIINPIKSESIDWDNQIAENTWSFELNWKYYLILNPYNPFTDEINSEKWIYKWVIINYNKYFEVNNEIKKVIDKLEKIIN